MPTARATLSTSVVNGKIYAVGGVGSDLAPAVSTVEEYDPAANTWTKRADMPTARSGLSTNVISGRIYAIGGQTGFFGSMPRDCLSTVEEYDPTTDTWTRKANMPTARALLSTSILDGRIYAIGGVQRTDQDIPISTVEEYDPATDAWAKKPNMLVVRFGLSTAAIDGRIYAIGGSNDGAWFNLVSAVEVFTPKDWQAARGEGKRLPP
jgi:N-acetylneuraminic acid mutarotase